MKAPIPIAKPCSADWSQMTGDDRKRLCEACGKHVHHLSAYSARELRDFQENRDGSECISYTIDSNGTAIVATRWSWLTSWLRPVRRGFAWALAFAIPSIFSGCAKQQPVTPGMPPPPPVKTKKASKAPDGQMLLGEPSVAPQPTPKPPKEPIIMGKPAAPPKPKKDS